MKGAEKITWFGKTFTGYLPQEWIIICLFFSGRLSRLWSAAKKKDTAATYYDEWFHLFF